MKYNFKYPILVILPILLVLNINSFAQTTFLHENFNTATGTTPPADWTVQTIIGESSIDLWRFDNIGRRKINYPIEGNFACFDSDKLSDNNQAEEVYLISPVFNATTDGEISLEFDQYFKAGYGSACTIEIFNGSNWIEIYNNEETTENSAHVFINVTSHIQNVINSQIRFKWQGNYSWFWIIDNIKVENIELDQFTEQESISLEGAEDGSSAWGDYDNDGDLDILLAGRREIDEYNAENFTKIYINNGNNSFTEQTNISLTKVGSSSLAWGDYDNDANIDILLTGYTGTPISKIYKNNGNNSFTEQSILSLQGVYSGSVALGDYDNDGDLDILLTGEEGYDAGYQEHSKIYRNNGNNSFTEQTDINLQNVSYSSVAWGDYDNDNDLDILLSGQDESHRGITKIYENYGDNNFGVSCSFTGVRSGSVAWGDYDNDGDLDILLAGTTGNGGEGITKIYKNNGNKAFSELNNINFPGLANSSVAWGDYDNDGDLDILLTGRSYSISHSRIYKNEGNDLFIEQSEITLTEVSQSNVAWGDYDNDGDLDILLTGKDKLGNSISKIYKNNNMVKNTPPTVPQNVAAYILDGKLNISWENSFDNETPQKGLTYNIRVGTSLGGSEIVSPMSLNNGKRTIVQSGNVGFNNYHFINLPDPLPENIYYSVQAVDKGFMGSGWSEEQTNISSIVPNFIPSNVCQLEETQYEDKSFSLNYQITSWQWKFIENEEIVIKTEQNPVHSFQTYGTHSIELTITNSNNETITRTKKVTVRPTPLSDFDAPTVCEGEQTTITNTTSANTTNIIAWLWEFGDGSSDSDDENLTSHTYNLGTYNLSLTVNSDNYCNHTITKEVYITELPSKLISIDGDVDFCYTDKTKIHVENQPYYTYQWFAGGVKTTDSTNYSLYPKYTNNYSVLINNTLASNCSVESNSISLNVKPSPPFVNITEPNNKTYCLNDQNSKLSAPLLSGYTYTWLSNGNAVASEKNKNTYIPEQPGIFDYRLQLTNSENCSTLSGNIVSGLTTLAIPDKPNVTSPSPEFCEGDAFTMETPLSSNYTYQWIVSGFTVENATKNTFSPTESGNYSVQITQSGCPNTSLATQVTVLSKPNAPSILNESTIPFCKGNNVTLNCNGDENLNYQWLWDGNKIGTNSQSQLADKSGNYTVSATSLNNCTSFSSNSIDILVNQLPTIPVIGLSGATYFCNGKSVTLSVTDNPNFTYQWKNSFGNIANANANSFTANSEENYFLNIVDENNCSVETESIEVLVSPSPIKPLINNNVSYSICEGENLELNTTEVSGLSYQWYLNGGALSNATNSNLAATQEGNYTIEATNSNDCPVESSNSVELTVNKIPTNTSIELSASPLICPGEPIVLSVEENAELTYQWIKDGKNIENATSSSYTANSEGFYSVKIMNNQCNTTSPQQAITEKVGPPIPEMYLRGDNVWYIGCSVTEGVTYQWYRNDTEIENSNAHILVPDPAQGSYYVKLDNGSECPSISETVIIPEDFNTAKFKSFELPKEQINEEFKIYPNPTKGAIKLEVSNDYKGKMLVKVRDYTGKELLIKKYEKASQTFAIDLDLSTFDRGIYLIEINYKTQKLLQKVILK